MTEHDPNTTSAETGRREDAARALNTLARTLYEEMEFLDPGLSEPPPWNFLPDRIKDFFRLSLSHVLAQRREVLLILECPDDDAILGRAHALEQANVEDQYPPKGATTRSVPKRRLKAMPQNGITVTPEMTEAGAHVILCHFGGLDFSCDPEVVAGLVYRAMTSLHRESQP